jgi:hypothetical protein
LAGEVLAVREKYHMQMGMKGACKQKKRHREVAAALFLKAAKSVC